MQGTSQRPFLTNAGDIIDAAFRLYRNNATLFLSVLGILLVPLAILDLISPAFNVLSVVATPFSLGALILAISARRSGVSITPSQAYAALGVGTGLSLLLAEILYGLMVGIGLILLIIPGIYLSRGAELIEIAVGAHHACPDDAVEGGIFPPDLQPIQLVVDLRPMLFDAP